MNTTRTKEDEEEDLDEEEKRKKWWSRCRLVLVLAFRGRRLRELQLLNKRQALSCRNTTY